MTQPQHRSWWTERRNVEYCVATVIAGIVAGVAGGAAAALLRFVEHLTYDYRIGTFLDAVAHTDDLRRALGPMVGGALAGLGWWLLRRREELPGLEKAIRSERPLPHRTFALDAAVQVSLVGAGASLGRESAAVKLAATLDDLVLGRLSLTDRDRQILLFCAGGAGLAAVYSIPLGGAMYAARVLLRTWEPRALVTAIVTSTIAVAVASPVTHLKPSLVWPGAHSSIMLWVVALATIPLAAAVGLAFKRLLAAATPRNQIRSWVLIPSIGASCLLTGICSMWLPELPGNGKTVLVITLAGGLTATTACAVFILKPLLTALVMRAGATGGALQPAVATGAAAGATVVLVLNHFARTDLDVAVTALACAAGVLAVTQRAPAFAALFVWDLARGPWWLLLTFTFTAFGAHGLRVLRDRRVAATPPVTSGQPEDGPKPRGEDSSHHRAPHRRP